DRPCAKVADHGAAVSKHRHCELRNKSHSRSHAECVWRDARRVWGREPAAPFGIGEITVVRSAAFHLDSVTGKSARAHLFKRALRLLNLFTAFCQASSGT